MIVILLEILLKEYVKRKIGKNMENPFFDEEANEIVQRLTNSPFAADGDVWLYWLFEISLIPGTWTCRFYLEQNDPKGKTYSFGGCGSPSEAVKQAYAKIDKEWLGKGLTEGKIQNEAFMKYWELRKKKDEYWFHFTKNKQFWGNGFTAKRLDVAKKELWDNKEFWDDILVRHAGMELTPEEMKQQNEKVYEHCMGNMTGMIMKFFIEKKIVK